MRLSSPTVTLLLLALCPTRSSRLGGATCRSDVRRDQQESGGATPVLRLRGGADPAGPLPKRQPARATPDSRDCERAPIARLNDLRDHSRVRARRRRPTLSRRLTTQQASGIMAFLEISSLCLQNCIVSFLLFVIRQIHTCVLNVKRFCS